MFNSTGAASQTFDSSVVDISSFLGAGTFSFSPFTTIENSTTGGGGNNTVTISTYASVTDQVQYFGRRRHVPEASTTFGILALAGVTFVSTKAKSLRKLAV